MTKPQKQSFVARLERNIVLDPGRIVGDDTHFEILERNGLYANVWNRRLGAFVDTETPEAVE